MIEFKKDGQVKNIKPEREKQIAVLKEAGWIETPVKAPKQKKEKRQ